MKSGVRQRWFQLLAQRTAAIGAVALVLMLVVLAASPELHRLVHADAGHPDHECAVTLFLHGVEAAPVALISVAILPILIERMAVIPEALLLEAPRHLLAPGRAPPSA
ncbi:MAG TPA: hypothetical protein VMC06_08315 [Opitutaceae bacterium]|nr:hypothetical protein [Opitutaceae bacterium]